MLQPACGPKPPFTYMPRLYEHYAPAPSFGCREVAHRHTHACNPGGDPHGAADIQVAESPECREGANVAAPTPLLPVQETDRRGLDLGREQLVG